jgi:hypothetical protein
MPRPLLESPQDMAAPDLASRIYSVGRYVRCERTAEMLYVVSDVTRSEIETISIAWVGPPRGEGGKVRESVSLTCNAALSASGELENSIITSEHVVRVTAAPFGPLATPTSQTDLSYNSRNMALFGGLTDGYLVP